MRSEITAAVLFLAQLTEKSEKFSPEQLEQFKSRLIELLTERFKNHWFPDKPFKGQGYRCIRVNGHSRRDTTLEKAANDAGVKYEDLSLPVELTLWIDPREVCCRFGESKGSYCTLASFDKEHKENIKSVRDNKENNDKENRHNDGSITMQVCSKFYFYQFPISRGEAAKLAHLLEISTLKKKYMNKNYEKICIE